MTAKIEPWMIEAMKSLHCAEYYTDAMAERDARHVAAHAPKQEDTQQESDTQPWRCWCGCCEVTNEWMQDFRDRSGTLWPYCRHYSNAAAPWFQKDCNSGHPEQNAFHDLIHAAEAKEKS